MFVRAPINLGLRADAADARRTKSSEQKHKEGLDVLAIETFATSYRRHSDRCQLAGRRWWRTCSRKAVGARPVGHRQTGHMMMLEKNSDIIAGMMSDWLERMLPDVER
jgi:hypothetical protein